MSMSIDGRFSGGAPYGRVWCGNYSRSNIKVERLNQVAILNCHKNYVEEVDMKTLINS